jgi:hypothetical protein
MTAFERFRRNVRCERVVPKLLLPSDVCDLLCRQLNGHFAGSDTPQIP